MPKWKLKVDNAQTCNIVYHHLDKLHIELMYTAQDRWGDLDGGVGAI